jgi:hypothetical protein
MASHPEQTTAELFCKLSSLNSYGFYLMCNFFSQGLAMSWAEEVNLFQYILQLPSSGGVSMWPPYTGLTIDVGRGV